MSKRVMFYSHDTFGLGHIRRTQKIANSIAGPEKSILVACSSPVATSFPSRPGIEYLSLPGIAKQVSGEYLPRALHLPIEEFVALRSSLLLAAVRNFRPQVLVIDKEPLGVKGELLPTLRYLRENNLPTKIVCGFRDILDEKQAIQEEWGRKGVLRGLEAYFDSLLVYGDEDTFDFVREYELPESLARKVRYTGYVQPHEDLERRPFTLDFAEPRPVVTLTLGGGGDGWSFIDIFLSMLERGLTDGALNHVLLAGPFANVQLVARAKKLASSRNDLRVIEFTSNSWGLFEASDLVISMGGYNSFCELLQLRKFPLILPRVTPREEQLIRARVFRAKGMCDYIHPGELSPEVLARKVLELAVADRSAVPAFAAKGIENIRNFIEESLRECAQKSGSSSKVIPA